MSKDRLLEGNQANPFTTSALMDFGEEEDLERGEEALPVSDATAIEPPSFVSTSTDGNEGESVPYKTTGRNQVSPSVPVTPQPTETRERKGSWFSCTRYQPFFDVDTEDVVSRCTSALTGTRVGASREEMQEKPDLYGPFWTCATLVFAAAAAGNFADWVKSTGSPDAWEYDVAKITFAALLFYGYASLVPLIMYVALRVWDARVDLATLFCFYGYALVAFIPTSILCAVPVPQLAWIAIVASVVISALFLAVAVRGTVVDAGLDKGKTSMLLLVAAGVHAVLGVSLKLYFFQY